MDFKNLEDFKEHAGSDDLMELNKFFKENNLKYKNDVEARGWFRGFIMPLDEAKKILVEEGYIKSDERQRDKPIEKTDTNDVDLKNFRFESDEILEIDRDFFGEELSDEAFSDVVGEIGAGDNDESWTEDIEFDDEVKSNNKKSKKNDEKKKKIQTQFVENNDYLDQQNKNEEVKTVEDAYKETIDKMTSELDSLNEYDENAQILDRSSVSENMLTNDPNAEQAFHGTGIAGDVSNFAQFIDLYASQMESGGVSSAFDDFNNSIMGMAFTSSGSQILEDIPPQSPTEHISGVHESINAENLGVDSGYILDEFGNLKSVGQINAQKEKSEYEIGQDTRDLQSRIDATISEKDRATSSNFDTQELPPTTMMKGEDFNSVYMEHFKDATSVEFSSAPIPEGTKTVDFSANGNGSILGYEHNGTVYISANQGVGADGSTTGSPIYFNPDSEKMFKDATNIHSINFGNDVIETNHVHNMSRMFENCTMLENANFEELKTASLAPNHGKSPIDSIFQGCSNLNKNDDFNNQASNWIKSANQSITENVNHNNANKNDERRQQDQYSNGSIFGTSPTSTPKTIYDSFKQEKSHMTAYEVGQKVEKVGATTKPLATAAINVVASQADQALKSEYTDKEFENMMNNGKKVSKSVVNGIFGLSVASSLKFERTDFKKTMNTAKLAGGIVGDNKYGISMDSLRNKSYKEIVKDLTDLKDSHGKQLLSDKQIKNIAQRRHGATDALCFQNAVRSKVGVILNVNNTQGLTKAQIKSVYKLTQVGITKLKPKEIINIADAYFATNKSSVLKGLKVSSMSKKEIGAILKGKSSRIKKSDLSNTDIAILKMAYNTPRQTSRAQKAGKGIRKISSATFSGMLKALNKTGSGAATEASQMIGNISGKARTIITASKTTLAIAAMYGKVGKAGLKLTGKLLGKTWPGKIVVRGGKKVKQAIGNSFRNSKLGKKIQKRKQKKEIKNRKKETKRLNKIKKKADAKEAIKKKMAQKRDKVLERARRTAAAKVLAKMRGKMQMIANSKFGKFAGMLGNIASKPFKAFSFLFKKLNLVKKAFERLMLYCAAGFFGFILIVIVVVLAISASMGGGTSAMALDVSIMSPAVVDEDDEPLDLTDEEFQDLWDEFSLLIQEKYDLTIDKQTAAEDSVVDMVDDTPSANGNPVTGWGGNDISEYGDHTNGANKGYWITYAPSMKRNAKDALMLTYMIMGNKDFYYEEDIRDELILDFIDVLNPEISDEDIIATIYPGSTFAVEDMRVYACLTGCDTIKYHCADDAAFDAFTKPGCNSKNKNYIGDKSRSDLLGCVRLSTDGTTIIANGDKIPTSTEPVIYADELLSHKYGDSCTTTCTGNEIITIEYEYLQTSKLFLGNGVPRDSTKVKKIIQKYDTKYKSATWNTEEKYWEIRDFKGEILKTVEPGEWFIEETVLQKRNLNAKLIDLGVTHGEKVIRPTSGGINSIDQVTGPDGIISIDESQLKDYVKRQTGITNVRKANIITSTCNSWKVTFECLGHEIKTCPNGHTDLGVTIKQYSVKDLKCFGGTYVDLPRDEMYNDYIDAFLELEDEERMSLLEWALAFKEQDWEEIYGVVEMNAVNCVENGKIGEEYIYNFLVNEEGFSNAQAAAFLGYIKVSSDFQINKKNEVEELFGLCQWGDEQLDTINRNHDENPPTLLEQLSLLSNEIRSPADSSGFSTLNDFFEFMNCKDNTEETVTKAAEILAKSWTYGKASDIEAVKNSAINYFRIIEDETSTFNNPRLKTICAYVTWALETAADPDHGYCQGKYQDTTDYACGTFVNAAISIGTDNELSPRWDMCIDFNKIEFPEGLSEDVLEFGDLIYMPSYGGDNHIEIYIGQGYGVGAHGADGPFGCSMGNERWEQRQSSWLDHVFHRSGDQGMGWEPGEAYTYNEIGVGKPSNLDKYKAVYRLKELN